MKIIQSNEVKLIKYWNRKRFLELHNSEDIPDLTNYWMSDSNSKCEICTGQLWNYMKKCF